MTPSYIEYVKVLHKQVVHDMETIPSDRQIRAEERHINRIDYNELILICRDCFSPPD